MKNVLLAVDFSDRSQAILRHTMKWATPADTKIWVLHVAAPDPEYVNFGGQGGGVDNYAGFKLKTANQEVQALVKRLKDKGYQAEGFLSKGKPTETILSEAAVVKADVIAIGDRGHGKLHDLVIGSVCQEVIRRSPIPVWVVPVRPEA